ncbi:hypothetical protein HRE53_32880 (plasmid) [Acaryochloris sp. 'Moss Beach']|uniref:hypothetical protein n=1 Tax=Acaryochloris sp. 'Moss Beach' TaxID=2740837 RepID=UPI001F1D164E|nr:hypothetical protein [Acaryochloris sp. 'Moss Beach']UJB73427.1 hypothetical protein HRE53_32880 [Acaryochloris sp. 'Moss Beach']
MYKYNSYKSIDNLLFNILDQEISSQYFSDFVRNEWHRYRFVFSCSEIKNLTKKILEFSSSIPESFHGRPDQPISKSQHFFGDKTEISSRFVNDFLASKDYPGEIELHTHPVDSIILVTEGYGSFIVKVRHEYTDYLISIPLTSGVAICFPSGTAHTMKLGGSSIHTFNITNRINQPPYRVESPTQNNPSFPMPSENFSQPAIINPRLDLISHKSFQHFFRSIFKSFC